MRAIVGVMFIGVTIYCVVCGWGAYQDYTNHLAMQQIAGDLSGEIGRELGSTGTVPTVADVKKHESFLQDNPFDPGSPIDIVDGKAKWPAGVIALITDGQKWELHPYGPKGDLKGVVPDLYYVYGYAGVGLLYFLMGLIAMAACGTKKVVQVAR